MALRLVPAAPAPPTVVGEVDVVVLRSAGAGDDRAARAFVSCYQRRVLTLCQRLLGDPRTAEDAAQESFWKAFAALPRFDPAGPAKVSTWLLTIATRTCIDELRKNKRRIPLGTSEGADVTDLTAVDRSDASATASSTRRRLETALATLPDEQRAVFALRVLLEQSVDDTAAALGVDVGTVKSRLSRARAALQAQLGDLR